MDTEGARVTYRIVIRGELGDRFALLFEGMNMERLNGMTIVTGRVGDQAQLVGLIGQVQELGLELVSVEQTDPAEESRRVRPQDHRMGN